MKLPEVLRHRHPAEPEEGPAPTGAPPPIEGYDALSVPVLCTRPPRRRHAEPQPHGSSRITRARSSDPALRRSCQTTASHGSQGYSVVFSGGSSRCRTTALNGSASVVVVASFGCST